MNQAAANHLQAHVESQALCQVVLQLLEACTLLPDARGSTLGM